MAASVFDDKAAKPTAQKLAKVFGESNGLCLVRWGKAHPT
jgi:hypothetical protein